MPIIKPACPYGFALDNTKCRCKRVITKKKKNIRSKNSISKLNLTQLNPTEMPTASKKIVQPNNIVEKSIIEKSVVKKNSSPKKTTQKSIPKNSSVENKTRKRCPNGTRRNKKTGICESVRKNKTNKKNTQGKKKTNTITKVIDNVSNPVERDIANSIFRELKSSNSKKKPSEIISKINFTPEMKKSFSPMINNVIVSLSPGTYENIFKCGITLNKVKQGEPLKISIGNKMVKKGGVVTSEPICVSSTSNKAKSVLLNNLKRVKSLDCSKIIAPVQKKSNCWFNTMFMTFFISDKGRKFFRFFRQLMIEGTHANGEKIKSSKMRNALFLFNLCIESSIGGNFDSDRRTALTMDTNNVIQYIYDSIPKKYKTLYKSIRKVDDSGNPYNYYYALSKYLDINNDMKMAKIKKRDQLLYIFNNSTNVILEQIPLQLIVESNIPDVLIFEMYDSENDYYTFDHKQTVRSNSIKKPLSITLQTKTTIKPVKYVIDSAIVRDTSKKHFSSCLTCNSHEKSYDGLSLSRLYDFEWKKLLNENVEWSFKYSPDYKKMSWNFMKCYQLLFYYRVQ